MLEAIMVISIIYACLFLPFKGKTPNQLNEGQMNRAQRYYNRYAAQCTKRGKPVESFEQYLPKLGKQGLVYLIVAIIMVPIYILAVVFIYAEIFGAF